MEPASPKYEKCENISEKEKNVSEPRTCFQEKDKPEKTQPKVTEKKMVKMSETEKVHTAPEIHVNEILPESQTTAELESVYTQITFDVDDNAEVSVELVESDDTYYDKEIETYDFIPRLRLQRQSVYTEVSKSGKFGLNLFCSMPALLIHSKPR